MSNFLKTEKVYSILELNNIVRTLIREEFPDYIWVCGEIQDYKARRDKKHIYFNLVQKHPEVNEIIAQAKAIIFENTIPYILKRLKSTDSSFELKDDIEVKLLCKIDFYPRWGEYRLVVVDIDPIYTLGQVAAHRQRIIEILKKKGIMEKNKILPFPSIPLRIGLITSWGSAAYHDFINELKNSGYGFKVFVWNSYMQGKLVERDIIAGLTFFNQHKEDLDVIVITRGGGSTADLSWFDNQRIAERIASVDLPVISGLGHEINTTITDLVVHTSCKTPTKVAQFLIERVSSFLDQIDYFQQEIFSEASDILERENRGLWRLAIEFDASLSKYFRDHYSALAEIKQDCFNLFSRLIDVRKKELQESFVFMKMYAENILNNAQKQIDYIEDKVNILDPVNILKRGYSITFKNGKVVKDAAFLKANDEIKTIFFKGEVVSKVERVIGDE